MGEHYYQKLKREWYDTIDLNQGNTAKRTPDKKCGNCAHYTDLINQSGNCSFKRKLVKSYSYDNCHNLKVLK